MKYSRPKTCSDSSWGGQARRVSTVKVGVAGTTPETDVNKTKQNFSMENFRQECAQVDRILSVMYLSASSLYCQFMADFVSSTLNLLFPPPAHWDYFTGNPREVHFCQEGTSKSPHKWPMLLVWRPQLPLNHSDHHGDADSSSTEMIQNLEIYTVGWFFKVVHYFQKVEICHSFSKLKISVVRPLGFDLEV